ncbi:DUF4326 domain-containing protein [Paractinoplanes rishiriensis]|uniref:DUF4326 domain-containing protein n=1 Tax=Paractinoplanes rishiriensis TaxID=1050105 RepID=A0A919JT33_9ACTN|nr:DUF4326 domain-containing protein [Actinoplanes rishiriensis]GIE92824.1 hypothetical protein Ari01nite_02890 [Actinoplanes rishiriensis]
MTPRRVQVPGGRFGGKYLPGDLVYVGRPAPYLQGSPFQNRHPLRGCRTCQAGHDRASSVAAFTRDLAADPDLMSAVRRDLVGRDLACWCPPDEPCHADILLLVAAGVDPLDALHELGVEET